MWSTASLCYIDFLGFLATYLRSFPTYCIWFETQEVYACMNCMFLAVWQELESPQRINRSKYDKNLPKNMHLRCFLLKSCWITVHITHQNIHLDEFYRSMQTTLGYCENSVKKQTKSSPRSPITSTLCYVAFLGYYAIYCSLITTFCILLKNTASSGIRIHKFVDVWLELGPPTMI